MGPPRVRPRSLALFVLLVVAAVLATGLAGASFFIVPKNAPVRFIVGLEPGVESASVASVGTASVLGADQELGFVVVETRHPSTLLATLLTDPGVRYVEPDLEVIRTLWTPNDPRYNDQYGLKKIRADGAWDVTRGSTSVVVAIGDSGLDTGHPDIGRLMAGRDFTGSNTLYDHCGHGTHVTGIAGATTNNGVGVSGVAQSTILPFKVIKSSCSGSFSHIASGVRWAADQGADVISLSLGCRGCSSTTLTDAIRHATYTRGALVIVAAGNNGCNGCVNYPATLSEVIAVSCTTSSDSVCSYSSRGPEVDIAAPGDNILSTERGGGYGHRGGTSMSAPHVAGVAALIMTKDPSLSASQVRSKLLSTAKDLGPSGEDNDYGHGRLDAAAALGATGGGSTPPPPPPPPPTKVTLLSEDFDDGSANGWTMDGLWRVGDGCLGASSGLRSLQYNREGACDYNTGGRNAGGAQFTIDLAGKTSPKLSFTSRHTVETYSAGSYDRLRVLVSADGGASWGTLWSKDSRSSTSGWQGATLDLSGYRSSATIVRFDFDTIDHIANSHPGWALDDVKVEASG